MGVPWNPGPTNAVTSVVFLELRRHRRSRGAILAFAGLSIFTTFWSLHQLSIAEYPPDASALTVSGFTVADPGVDLLLLDVATHPFVTPVLLGAGVLLGATTVSGPRESGTLRTVQVLPYSRRTVFVGLVLSRTLLLAVPVVLLLGGTMIQAYRLGVHPSPPLAVLLGVALVLHVAGGVAVGGLLSTLGARRSRTIVLAIASTIGLLALDGLLAPFSPSIRALSPALAYRAVLASGHRDWTPTALVSGDASGLVAPATSPVDLSVTLAAVAVLLAWIVVPAVLGSILYARADLARP